MAFSAITPREICILLTLIVAVALAVPLPARVARTVFVALIVVGIANAIALNRQPHNLLQGNLAHYFIGAKYPVPYKDFYRAINAAREKPQIDMRDLEKPSRQVRATPREQRAYYIDLMREEGVEFDALVSLGELHHRAQVTGALRREAHRVLRENLREERIDDFRRDVGLATSIPSIRDMTHDAGYNGSPFYTLVRQADPTLYTAFGPTTAWLNLVWQCLAAIALAWLMGVALGVTLTMRLAMAALVFASWDFISFALPGLIFAGLWLPVAFALYAMHRRAAAPAGVAVAWAGLIKLFPLILLLPAAMRLMRTTALRIRHVATSDATRPWVLMLLSALVAAAVLAFAATFAGRSWSGFFAKIVAQFSLGTSSGNNVSLVRALSTLGISESVSLLPTILSVVSLAVLAAMFLRDNDRDFADKLPRRSLVLIGALGWVAHNWLNYYSIAPLLLLPLLTREHRIGAPLAVGAMAAAAYLPEFNDPVIAARPLFAALKLAPYLMIPAWLVLLEFRSMRWGKRARYVALIACTLCVLATAGEAWRVATIGKLTATGKEQLDRRQLQAALATYKRLARLSPRNHDAYNGQAVACVQLGDHDNAERNFARAVRFNPDDMGVRRNYASILWTMGRKEEAVREFEDIHKLAPLDEYVLLTLAQLRLGQERIDEARALLVRALELDPSRESIRKTLGDLDAQQR